MLELLKTVNDSAATIEAKGRLDTTTAPELENMIREIQGTVETLVLDFGGLEYISSAGLRVLLSAEKAAKTNGRMVLRHVQPAVMEIFEVTGFSDILTIES